jgi:Gpi18-like mannosyltransferase
MRRLASPNLPLAALAVVSPLLYLGYSLHYGFVGFPLDDGWIHQTYARNLGVYHQFAYNLGEPSVGFTSPLWMLLLSPAHVLRLEPRLWAYLLGALFLALTACLLQRLSSLLFPKNRLLPLATAAFCLLEWHLAWAALSGMETMLFVFLSLLVLERQLSGERPLLTGLIVGLLTLTRPEGAMMLVLLIGDTLWQNARNAGQWSLARCGTKISLLVLGFILPTAPYLALNLTITGNPFPNTF